MSTRDEIATAIMDFGQVRYDLGIAAGENQSVPTQQALAVTANRALRRALALIEPLLAPEPEPEPSDAEIEAASKALNELQGVMSRNLWRAVPRWDEVAKPVLAAARAARQTGGA